TGGGTTGGGTTGGGTTGGGTTGGGTTPASCTFNSQTVAHGGSVTGYSASSVAYGSTCQSETRTCSDGTLSGSFTHASCTVESPAMSGSVQTFGSSASSRMMSRSTASTGSTSVSVNQPVKSLVSLYLLVDEKLKYPIAKIKSGTDGSYVVAPSDVKNFLINPPTDNLSNDYGYLLPDAVVGIDNTSTDTQIIAAFNALGSLQVRALYVSDGKAKVISAMADPASNEPVRIDPIVQRVAQQIISSMQETLKETITALTGLSDAAKKEILANAENAIKNTVSQELTAVKTQTNFEVPEGTDMSDPEALLEVEMDPTTAAELESAIASDAAEVAVDTTKLAVEDKGKLSDTLSDEQKGEFAKKNEAAASSVTNTVSAGATSLSAAEKTALKEKAKQIKAKSLRS
ncbi:MAG: hypothetical protein VXY89_14455, partial [SAR324 cluster bacterium]|nr:hypothetical protein [SAR324 cluster bacterium]